MSALPTALPVTTPAATEAIAGLLLVHVPPGVTSARVVVPARHTFVLPVIAAVVLDPTVIGKVAKQPVLVYVIVTRPDAIPVTIPAEFTVAFVASLVVHVPPVVTDASVVVFPMQRVAEPVIAAGDVPFTISVLVA